MSIASADELCVALEAVLRGHLAETITLLGWDPDVFQPIREWQQLPTLEALSTATFPAVAIASPGLQGEPQHSRADCGYRATWRIGVGIYDRGKDHADTQARVRDWCAAVRLTVRAHRTLSGVATGTSWAGDRYELIPNRNQARTFGAGAVALDVSALVIDTLGIRPTVASTPTSLSVQ